MKVWFAANILSDSYGGVGKSMIGLSEGLRYRGHEVKIVYCPAWIKGNYILFAVYLACLTVMSVHKKPQWIVARSTDGVLCALLKRLSIIKTRIALHNHGWEELVAETEKRLPVSVVTSPTTWRAKLVRFNLLRAALSMCDVCISGTVSEIRWISSRHPKAKGKCAYVPNGVDVKEKIFWINREPVPARFLLVGGPTWKKNTGYACEVFSFIRKRMHDAELFIVGTGSSTMEFGESCGIRGVPFAKWDEMDAWYSSCPYLVATSRFEGGHSLAVLEAMSYGAIVFVSPIASNTEVVKNGKNGCVLSCVDPAADAALICGVAEQKKTFDYLREKAFLTAMNNKWDRQAARLERVLCR